MGKGVPWTFFRRRYAISRMKTYEKTLNIISHCCCCCCCWGSQNHDVIPLQTVGQQK